MNKTILVTVFLHFSLIWLISGEHRCGSAYGPQLSYTEIYECLEMFCLCNRYDNCSRLSPIEDVMMMLMDRHNGVIMCTERYTKQNEPNGRPMIWMGDTDKVNESFLMSMIKETDEMYRICFYYGSFDKYTRGLLSFRYMEFVTDNAFWPVRFHNLFHGMNVNTSGLLNGELTFGKRY